MKDYDYFFSIDKTQSMFRGEGIPLQHIVKFLDMNESKLLLLDPNGFTFPKEKNTNLQIVDKKDIGFLVKQMDHTGNFSFVKVSDAVIPGITDQELGLLLYFMVYGILDCNCLLNKFDMLYATHDNGYPSIIYAHNIQNIVSSFVQEKLYEIADDILNNLEKGVYVKRKKIVQIGE